MDRCNFLAIFAIFMAFIDAGDGYVAQRAIQMWSTSRSASPKSIDNPYRVVKNDIEIVYKEVPSSSVLLSVDLGLRSGFALYNSTGHLISFAHHRFDTLQNLEASVLVELSSLSKVYNLNHFVLEGDAVYGSIWTSAINQFAADYEKNAVIIYIAPAEWRDRLLTSKERKSGKDAKCASRLISRQIMWRSGKIMVTYATILYSTILFHCLASSRLRSFLSDLLQT
jgi:hypothetical protein